ncbi:Zinc finger, C6HC-type [Penicillium expansum]|uniref:Zinc finger, C6HC-type n=1 Tax=Penicillium expansum TaxID=27334 RepID=A0A0A2IKG2_PENEN|nr:Zinc finger, C6HC-type [Penicillium expansum]KGO42938.1 Zinc finger, C6HC-type [Penicillium expansum]KGO55044.1 Zinc finger, C6HC-type [Penicillium expansum]KGO57059.1 Zinc finger, C6HC-type [Penicillium expansum]
MADQNTSLGSLMEPKRSAELADHITSDDSDEDMLDEGPNDDDAAEISEEETETRQQCASAAVEDMIGIEMAKRYKERKTEMSDYGRTYCAIPTCSHYIPPQNIRRGVGICGLCKARTCTDCKSQGHRGDCNYKKVKARKKAIAKEKAAAKKKATAQKRAMAKEKAIAKKKAMEEEMANDENYQLLEKLAKKKKWQRCSKCSRIIERVTGCWHVVKLPSKKTMKV